MKMQAHMPWIQETSLKRNVASGWKDGSDSAEWSNSNLSASRGAHHEARLRNCRHQALKKVEARREQDELKVGREVGFPAPPPPTPSS